MAENSKIEWTTHTFNPWRGCTKISEGCKHCYAETLSKRNPATLGIWGDNGTRVVASDGYWKQPLKWNRDAEKTGERPRVFCASLADWLEDRPELVEPRARLIKLIHATPNLDWLLLSKRTENWRDLVDEACEYEHGETWQSLWTQGEAPENIWIGTTVENQEQADKRIPELLKIPAQVRFLSCEPLLGPVELYKWMKGDGHDQPWMEGIDWVIAGGESGPGARPAHPDWFRSLRDQCTAAGVPFLFKQQGEWQYGSKIGSVNHIVLSDGRHGETPQDIGWSLTQPNADHRWHALNPTMMAKVGKKAAGRILDGREWNELPHTGEK